MNIKRNIIFALEARKQVWLQGHGFNPIGLCKSKSKEKSLALFSLLCRTEVSKTAGLRYEIKQ